MSGRGDTADGTELEAAARRLTALADRLRAVRAQLDANAPPPGPAGGSVPAGYTPDGDGAKGEAH
ncbi:MAG TPA: hypothetical protein VHM31_10820 [Polyangia bacterium]|nr:hypothetical protein [Polyangia bacterium]